MIRLGEDSTQPILSTLEFPQQPITQPSKRKLNKKIISMFLIAVVFCSLLGTLGYLYLDLSSKYKSLQLEHTKLQGSYSQLSSNYNDLNTQHANLNTQYQILSTNYEPLSTAFNEPLSVKQVPSTNELKEWLASDNTDTLTYSMPNFICGDFAVMLSQHAKLKHWDMGIVAISGYDRDTLESYDHVINHIYTLEGLVYVEPQEDHVWWYNDWHEEISSGSTWEIADNQWITVTHYTTVVWE